MKKQGRMFIGALLIILGLMFLLGNLLDINMWAICWPVGLILLGVWLILRPQTIGSNMAIQQKLLGDIHRSGAWQVTNEEFWIGVGDVDLDMLNADIPDGETKLRVFGFVGDVEMLMPSNVGISVNCMGVITDVKIMGKEQTTFLSPFHLVSDDYMTAERKVLIETSFFVGEIKIRRV